MSMRALLRILLFVIWAYCPIAAASQPMIINYPNTMDSAATDAKAYKLELIKLLLDSTRAEYGDYTLNLPVLNVSGVKRQSLLISEAKQINVLWTTPSSPIAMAEAIQIPVDILRGLLGYRICLINRNGSANFDSVTDVASLGKISVAQGLGWPDVDIYEFNNIQPITTNSFEALVSMLAANRFSCLPLGINEINGSLQDYSAKMPMLAIEPNIIIYYDFPIYFYVSAKTPEVAERFKLGFKKIAANGKFERLFLKYHQSQLENLNLRSRRTICLKNPGMPLEKQCQSSTLPKSF